MGYPLLDMRAFQNKNKINKLESIFVKLSEQRTEDIKCVHCDYFNFERGVKLD